MQLPRLLKFAGSIVQSTVQSAVLRYRIGVHLWALILITILASSCNPPSSNSVVRVALSGLPNTLDPHRTSATLTFQVLRSVYDTLVEPDADGLIVPALAHRWQVSNDELEWTFYLRENAYFHNGEPVTATDVAASIARLSEPDSPRAAEFEVINQITIIDPHTIQFSLASPYAPLLASLASGWAAILPSSLVAQGHNFALHPVGSGPFVFQEWKQDHSIVLAKHHQYWKDNQPTVEEILFYILTENTTRVQALIQGQIDVLDVVEPTDIPLLESDPNARVTRQLSSLAMVISINTMHPLLQDIRLRQAMGYAIDRQRVLDQAYGGGVIIDTFMDASDPYYPPNIEPLYRYNPSKARMLIQEYSQEHEQDHNPLNQQIIMKIPQNFEPHVRAAEIYQQMLAEVGFNVSIQLVDWPTWIGEVYTNANYDLTVIGHTGRLDPESRFQEYAYTNWDNATLTALTQRARQVSDIGARKEIYNQAFDIMAAELPFIFIGTNYRYIVTHSSIENVVVDAKLDTFDFRRVRTLD